MKRRVSTHQLNAGFAQLYYGLVYSVRSTLALSPRQLFLHSCSGALWPRQLFLFKTKLIIWGRVAVSKSLKILAMSRRVGGGGAGLESKEDF